MRYFSKKIVLHLIDNLPTTPDGTTTVVASGPGFALVNNRDVVVLVDTIERPEEIDANRARREYEEAQEALRQKQSQKEHRMTEMALAKALGRLQVKDHYR
ncbi:MAG: F0F1 ATP synthase subunit epsilon, partial [Clostridiales bacterium]|nr:F0F1 ATP synthase subunit epsilon [Clostridiales bacterium]